LSLIHLTLNNLVNRSSLGSSYTTW